MTPVFYARAEIVENEPKPGDAYVTYCATGRTFFSVDGIEVSAEEYQRLYAIHFPGVEQR